jgi:hypothetical protein
MDLEYSNFHGELMIRNDDAMEDISTGLGDPGPRGPSGRVPTEHWALYIISGKIASTLVCEPSGMLAPLRPPMLLPVDNRTEGLSG